MADLEKAYKLMEKNCGLKEGDKVRIMRKAKTRELGWNNVWVEPMDNVVGKEATVDSVSKHGLGIRFKGMPYYYPWFVLEKIASAPPKIVIDGKEIEISQESFNNLKKQLGV